MKLSYCDRSKRVQSMMITRLDHDRIDRTGIVHAENENEFLWSIELRAIYSESQIGQQRNWSYMIGLHQNWKMNGLDLFDLVRSIMKIR